VPLGKSFSQLAARHYAPKEYDFGHFYAKALRWLGNDQLLVGLDAMTSEASSREGQAPGVRNWYCGYIMSPEKRQVIRQLDGSDLRREFDIDLEKEPW
jgi:hypothetical protein